MIRRREFVILLGGTAAWPLAARAQDERTRRVGLLMGDGSLVLISQFRDGMARLGWVEGRNLQIDLRVASDVGRFRTYAAELVSFAPEVIVAITVAATRAVQQQTQTVPIVIAGVGDPVANGIVKSLARPEGNTTGITNLFASIGGKWLQLLKEVAPKVERVALIYNAQIARGNSYLSPIEETAGVLAVQAIRIGYRDAADLVHAIDAFGAQPNGGLIVVPPPPTPADREAILQLATKYRLPTIYQARPYVAEGGLMAYGVTRGQLMSRASYYVDRILRGAKVNELPVEYPTEFELVINLKTAKAIGLTIPESFLFRADEVIE